MAWSGRSKVGMLAASQSFEIQRFLEILASSRVPKLAFQLARRQALWQCPAAHGRAPFCASHFFGALAFS
jgi:hypothetical protein